MPRRNDSDKLLCADGIAGKIVAITNVDSLGPMCSAFRVQGVAPLPEDYTDLSEGTLLSVTISDVQSVYEEMVPGLTANKTLYNSL